MLQHKQQSFTSTGNFLPEGSRKGHLNKDSIKGQGSQQMFEHKKQSLTSTENSLPKGSRQGQLDRDSVKRTICATKTSERKKSTFT